VSAQIETPSYLQLLAFLDQTAAAAATTILSQRVIDDNCVDDALPKEPMPLQSHFSSSSGQVDEDVDFVLNQLTVCTAKQLPGAVTMGGSPCKLVNLSMSHLLRCTFRSVDRTGTGILMPSLITTSFSESPKFNYRRGDGEDNNKTQQHDMKLGCSSGDSKWVSK
jgi:hypothetical protein